MAQLINLSMQSIGTKMIVLEFLQGPDRRINFGTMNLTQTGEKGFLFIRSVLWSRLAEIAQG